MGFGFFVKLTIVMLSMQRLEGCLFRDRQKNIATRSLKNPKTGAELQSAINNASPGDTIDLLPINYSGDFVLPDKGLSDTITIKGHSTNDGKSSTIFGSKVAMEISEGSWKLLDFGVASGRAGIKVMGSKHFLKSLSITGVDHGVIVFGDLNRLESLSVSGGKKGITINGNENLIKSSSCTGQSSYGVLVETGNKTDIDSLSVTDAKKSSVILNEKTCCGNMKSSSLDGLLEVKGQNYNIDSLSSSKKVNILGCGNVISSSSIANLFVTKGCTNDFTKGNSIEQFVEKPF